jgi:hypothetical protein
MNTELVAPLVDEAEEDAAEDADDDAADEAEDAAEAADEAVLAWPNGVAPYAPSNMTIIWSIRNIKTPKNIRAMMTIIVILSTSWRVGQVVRLISRRTFLK